MAELVRNVLYAGLAGALMAAALAGFCFFLYLLIRLIRLVRWLRKSPEERQNLRARKRAAKGHAFARAPGRERTAYLISCLEAALTVYSQAPGDWQWVLERLRPLADAGAELEPFWRVVVLLPANVLPFPRQEARIVDAVYEDLMELWDPAREAEVLPEERFRFLRALYLKEGWRMCVFTPLLLEIYDHAYAVREYGDAPVPGALECIDCAEELLYLWSIPLERLERLVTGS